MFGRPGEQLRLFAPAQELIQGLFKGDIGSHESDLFLGSDNPTPDDTRAANVSLMNQKKDEAAKPRERFAHGSGTYDSIKAEGFKGHIQMDISRDKPALWEGHHRLGAAHDLGEQFVGLDYLDPKGRYGPMEKDKPSIESRYPQNPNWPSSVA